MITINLKASENISEYKLVSIAHTVNADKSQAWASYLVQVISSFVINMEINFHQDHHIHQVWKNLTLQNCQEF